MTTTLVTEILRDAVWVILKVSGPILGVALVIGLIIALFQALTQIQEMTLTFVPKIAAVLLRSFLVEFHNYLRVVNGNLWFHRIIRIFYCFSSC